MLIKIAIIFLALMVGIAMLFRLRIGGIGRKSGPVPKPLICGRCGQFIIGKGDCNCRSRRG